MNLARYFSYTQLLESQLERERTNHEREKAAWANERLELSNEAAHSLADAQRRHDEDRAAWDEERRHLINVAMLKHGVNAPFVPQSTTTTSNGKKRTRAIGPWQINAREALDEEKIEQAKDEVARAPELAPIVDEGPPLSDAQKARIRADAEARGLLKERAVSEPAVV